VEVSIQACCETRACVDVSIKACCETRACVDVSTRAYTLYAMRHATCATAGKNVLVRRSYVWLAGKKGFNFQATMTSSACRFPPSRFQAIMNELCLLFLTLRMKYSKGKPLLFLTLLHLCTTVIL